MRHLFSYLPRAALVGVACLAGSATPTFADIPVGTLQCEVSAGVGMIVASSRTLSCVYHPQRGRAQRYTGRIDRVGLDLGATSAAQLAWAVFAAAPQTGSLTGQYSGLSAGLAIVAGGFNANTLVGGPGNTISMQPLVSPQTGANIAAGIGAMNLEPAASPVNRRHVRHHHMRG